RPDHYSIHTLTLHDALPIYDSCERSQGARLSRLGGFEEPWISRFEVGWAPEGWDGLLNALTKLLPAQVMEQAGLIVRRGDGTGQDRKSTRLNSSHVAISYAV